MNIYEEYMRAHHEYMKTIDEYASDYGNMSLLEKLKKQEKQLQDIINKNKKI